MALNDHEVRWFTDTFATLTPEELAERWEGLQGLDELRGLIHADLIKRGGDAFERFDTALEGRVDVF